MISVKVFLTAFTWCSHLQKISSVSFGCWTLTLIHTRPYKNSSTKFVNQMCEYPNCKTKAKPINYCVALIILLKIKMAIFIFTFQNLNKVISIFFYECLNLEVMRWNNKVHRIIWEIWSELQIFRREFMLY